MLQNTVKDNIKSALETAGYNTGSANIELIYQVYMSSTGGCNFGKLVKEYGRYLKR